MKKIDVLIVVQGEEIMNLINDKVLKPGTFNDPVNVKYLSEGSLYAISEGTSTISVASNDSIVSIDAEQGDVIKFSIDTQSKAQEATPFFYKPTIKMPRTDIDLFIFEAHDDVYLPPSEDPTVQPNKYKNTYSKAQGFVVRTNDVLVNTFTFGIVDNSSGKVLGYFKWDLALEIQ